MSLDSSNFKDDISVIKGSKNELIVFEKETDTLSFLELLKLNNNNRTLITLNSAILQVTRINFLIDLMILMVKYFCVWKGAE